MRMPMPTDKEKKAWPNAALQTPGLASAEKSGRRKKSMPGLNPGRLRQNITRTTRMTNANGIRKDTILSMPSLTPRLTIIPVASAEIKK